MINPDENVEDILREWRAAQAAGGGAARPGPRFVIELREAADAQRPVIEGRLRDLLKIDVGLEMLFDGAEGELARFLRFDVPGIGRPDRRDLFDVANAVRGALGAATVEPDLGADHYDWDGDHDVGAGPESADHAFWCWAPDQDAPQNLDWALRKLGLFNAWAESPAGRGKGAGIRIFQPDTGVVSPHGELPDGLLDARGARNFVEPGKAPRDPMTGDNPGHGTATGSVIVSDAAKGVIGAAPVASLVPLRALTSVAVFDQSRVAAAIEHARQSGAHVISLSLGGVPSAALHAAVRRAVADNVIVLAAAGNCVQLVVYPARYPEVIAIGGSNVNDEPWRGSSSGPAVLVSAPAEFVPCADAHFPDNPGRMNRKGQGTSFATALTAGVAASWLSHHGRDALLAIATKNQRTLQDMFRNLLIHSARTPAAGWRTDMFGAGIVNALGLFRIDPETAFSKDLDTWRPPESGLIDLIGGLFGGGLEAAPALASETRAHDLELAALALDQARHGRTRRAVLENAPGASLSASLRRALARAGGHP